MSQIVYRVSLLIMLIKKQLLRNVDYTLYVRQYLKKLKTSKTSIFYVKQLNLEIKIRHNFFNFSVD